MDEEEKLDALRQDFFSYYRRMRSNLFSDTEIVYELSLIHISEPTRPY